MIVECYIRSKKTIILHMTEKVKGVLRGTISKDLICVLRSTGLFILLFALYWIVLRYNIEPTLHIDKLVLIGGLGLLFRMFLSLEMRQYILLPAGVLLLGWVVGLPKLMYTTLFSGVIIYLLHRYYHSIVSRVLVFAIFLSLVTLVLFNPPWVQRNFIVFSILGSMFLFRLLNFLYDRKFVSEDGSKSDTIHSISYFYLAPNFGVLLFPAIDYKTFLTKYLSVNDFALYSKGIQWMVTGVFHLVVYRVIYSYLLFPVSEVETLSEFFRYAIPNYMLIVRLSGIFHFVAGLLCLFGYDLPRTFNNYFLAHSFSDLWRRINIYFKDFMVKVFYYPIFFRIRKIGTIKAIVLTVLILFTISWFFHSYQWFWFKGYFPVKLVDLVYWNMFGVFVAINAVYEYHNPGSARYHGIWHESWVMAGKIILTFLTMSLLWALWSADSLSSWYSMICKVLGSPLIEFGYVVATLCLIYILSVIIYYGCRRFRAASVINPEAKSTLGYFWSFLMLISLTIVLIPSFRDAFWERTGLRLEPLTRIDLNTKDEELIIEGYYAEILFGNTLTSPIAESVSSKAEQFQHSEGAVSIFDFRKIKMKPSTSFIFKDKPFTINRMGGRGREYDFEREVDVVRTIFLGGSFVAGSGVADDEVFTSILEQLFLDSTIYYTECMNFGCPEYDLIDVLVHADELELLSLKPDFLVYVSQGKDFSKNIRDIAYAHENNIPLPYAYLDAIVKEAGISDAMTLEQKIKALEPFGERILKETYDVLYGMLEKDGIKPIWVYWPTVITKPALLLEKEKVKLIAEKSGFEVWDLEKLYEGYQIDALKVAPNDNHPNALGHRLVAIALKDRMMVLLSSYLDKGAKSQ
jgi:hypothetical protein